MKLPFYQKKRIVSRQNRANIFLLTGLFFIATVFYLFLSQYLFIKKAQIVIGKVIGYEIPKNRNLEVPLIEYVSSDNKTHVYRHSEGTNPPTYRIGEQIKIYCNPANNEDIILGFSYIPIIILLIFGVIFSIVGFAMKS